MAREIFIRGWVKTLSQKADVHARQSPPTNDMVLTKVDACGKVYYVLKSDRWAFDNICDLVEQLKEADVPYHTRKGR